MKKTGIPKGTRDYPPAAMARRRYIFRTIEDVFRLFGYQPIETPAMESLDTLLGKYGDEGDKLLFKILNSGDFLSALSDDQLNRGDSGKISTLISEKGLRYDLTVPLARYVVQHRSEITFPFRRYQIQPVWRADRPQKGRYREFFQCDADIVGSRSMLNELELIEIIDQVFDRLGMGVLVKINHRKILSGMAEIPGGSGLMADIAATFDKLDRIGVEKVLDELKGRGIQEETLNKIRSIIRISGDNGTKLLKLEDILEGSNTGKQGILELKSLLAYLDGTDLKADVHLDFSLARGLDYYTGVIIEVLSRDMEIGSICGGGRYDDLTGIFGLGDVSGVGISFGADRIFDVLEKKDLFPGEIITGTRLLFVNFGRREEEFILSVLPEFRKAGIETELYPDPVKLKKQMAYANNNSIPFVALVGEDELQKQVLTLKDMNSGEQQELSVEETIRRLGR